MPSWADQLLPQLLLLIEQFFDILPIQCRHIEHLHEGVGLKKLTNNIYENLDKFPIYHFCICIDSAFKGLEPTQTLFVDSKLFSSYPFISPLTNFVCCFHIVHLCVCLSLCNILFPKHHKESALEFPQTLQTYLYIQDKYF